jgi:hypothetical protein
LKPTALAKGRGKSKGSWIKVMTKPREDHKFVLCIENEDCDDLEKRKVYKVLPDEEAQKEGCLRVIDESGEDYLYPQSYFIVVRLPHEAQKALGLSE